VIGLHCRQFIALDPRLAGANQFFGCAGTRIRRARKAVPIAKAKNATRQRAGGVWMRGENKASLCGEFGHK